MGPPWRLATTSRAGAANAPAGIIGGDVMKTMAVLFGFAALLAGCASAPPRQVDTDYVAGRTDFPPDLGRYAPRVESEITMVYVPVEVERACAGLDPEFPFDSSRVAMGKRSLLVLSSCMKSGPLAGRVVRLVGRADVRGSDPYNDRLGLQRAEAIKLFLMKTGIPSERLLTETRGKRDAKSPPSDSDRRVDFEIAR
jgi:outer membrane protein OmpA-like peptidoglycan-associated protein